MFCQHDVINMSEAENKMEQAVPKRKYRLIIDFKCQFPEKLYDVANDGYLIYWNRDDSVSIKDEDEFERDVMTLYPGFLQISTVLNLKRLFREYGFDRDVGQNGVLKFYHECFQRGRRELLREIRTRRKSYSKPHNESRDSFEIEPEDGKRYPTRKRKSSRFNGNSSAPTPEKAESGAWGDFIERSSTLFHIKKPNLNPACESHETARSENQPPMNEKVPLNKNDLNRMMSKFATNEFSEQEYQVWMAKQRRLDELKTNRLVEEKNKETSKDFWWMYGEKPDVSDNNKASSSMNDSVEQDSCMPCGFCKCCSAISNYVHIFGEVPENIQVYDIVEEVFESEDAATSAGADSQQ